jgi:hypothetical protein
MGHSRSQSEGWHDSRPGTGRRRDDAREWPLQPQAEEAPLRTAEQLPMMIWSVRGSLPRQQQSCSLVSLSWRLRGRKEHRTGMFGTQPLLCREGGYEKWNTGIKLHHECRVIPAAAQRHLAYCFSKIATLNIESKLPRNLLSATHHSYEMLTRRQHKGSQKNRSRHRGI